MEIFKKLLTKGFLYKEYIVNKKSTRQIAKWLVVRKELF